MNTIKVNKKNCLFVAHRGCSGIEKENTNAAFVAAGNRSYFGIETDIHQTIDGKYVLFHDDTTKRVAIDNMVVEESTYETLRNLILTDKDGIKRKNAEVVADNVYFGDSKPENQGTRAYGTTAADSYGGAYAAQPGPFAELVDEDDGELPF